MDAHGHFLLYVPAGAPKPRQDGLEGQIGRLAALIGRLEDKVGTVLARHRPGHLARVPKALLKLHVPIDEGIEASHRGSVTPSRDRQREY